MKKVISPSRATVLLSAHPSLSAPCFPRERQTLLFPPPHPAPGHKHTILFPGIQCQRHNKALPGSQHFSRPPLYCRKAAMPYPLPKHKIRSASSVSTALKFQPPEASVKSMAALSGVRSPAVTRFSMTVPSLSLTILNRRFMIVFYWTGCCRMWMGLRS